MFPNDILRMCNKIFTTENFIHFEPGDIVFMPPHYTYFLRLHYGEHMIYCPNVTFVTVGFDYPMEAFISKNTFESIINNPNLKEWIVDYTFIQGDYPKLKRIITERGRKSKECSSILDIGDFVARGDVPIIRTPLEYAKILKDYINFISPPGYLKYYYSSQDDPVVRDSEMILPNYKIKNSRDTIKIEGTYKMSVDQAENIMKYIKEHTDKLSIRFRARPWNSEIYYVNILDKEKMFNE